MQITALALLPKYCCQKDAWTLPRKFHSCKIFICPVIKLDSVTLLQEKPLNIRSIRRATLRAQFGKVGLMPLLQLRVFNWTVFRQLCAEPKTLDTCRQNNCIAELPSGTIGTILNPHGMAQTQPARYGAGVSHGSAYEGRHSLGCDVTYSKDGGSRFLRYVCSCLPD
jgi:hypothetical protein